MYRAIQANLNSEQGVANACSNSHFKNRFNLIVPIADTYKHRGKSIYIHGISTIGSGNSLLARSGTYSFPDIPTSQIVGNIDVLTKSGNDYYVRGWACQKYFTKSIDVHVYAGGGAGSGGTHVATGTANLTSSSAIANACGTSATAYRYDLKIPADKVNQFAGESIYVHGISIVGTSNLAINNSGTFKLPNSGSTVKYEYNALGRLERVYEDNVLREDYTYDEAGNRKTVENKN